MAKRKSANSSVNSLKHKDKRKNIPTAELQDFVREEEIKPKIAKHKGLLYACDHSLDPQLVWTGKAENTSFEVPTLSLHIHERIAPEAIIRSVKREPAQADLFAKPDMPLKELVEFYQHDMD